MLHTFHSPLFKQGDLHYVCHLEQVIVFWVTLILSVIAVLKCNDNKEEIFPDMYFIVT
jgi:hypothetical protein